MERVIHKIVGTCKVCLYLQTYRYDFQLFTCGHPVALEGQGLVKFNMGDVKNKISHTKLDQIPEWCPLPSNLGKCNKWNFRNTAFLRLKLFALYDIGTTPHEVEKEIRPKKYRNRLWIPQTMGGQVWLWYEFETFAEEEAFVSSIPQKYKDIQGFIGDNFSEKDLDHWTGYESYY